MVTGTNDHLQEIDGMKIYSIARSDCPSCYDTAYKCSDFVGLIIPNTVVG